jgi:hypothetical protein
MRTSLDASFQRYIEGLCSPGWGVGRTKVINKGRKGLNHEEEEEQTFFKQRITGKFGQIDLELLFPLEIGGEGISKRTMPPYFHISPSISFTFSLENPVRRNSTP